MKNIHVSRNQFLALAGVIVCSLPRCAAGPVEVPWNQLCKAANGNHLMITTVDGATVDGLCMSITVDEVAIRTETQQVVKIARAALSRIQMHRGIQQQHPLKALAKSLRGSFREGFEMLFTPEAPAGIVLLPAAAAWGVVAAPFCALGELKNKLEKPREVKVIWVGAFPDLPSGPRFDGRDRLQLQESIYVHSARKTIDQVQAHHGRRRGAPAPRVRVRQHHRFRSIPAAGRFSQ
jgi:hypothetical protein